MSVALLIIDVQQGLCEGEDAAFDCENLIQKINLITSKARQAGIPVIFIQHESNVGYLEYDTREWQIAEGVQVEQTDLRVRKTTPDSFLDTDLQKILATYGVSEIVIAGMHTEFCVDTTSRRALALGYPVVLVEDAHTSAGNDVLTAAQVIAHHNITLSNISSFGPRVRIVRSENLTF